MRGTSVRVALFLERAGGTSMHGPPPATCNSSSVHAATPGGGKLLRWPSYRTQLTTTTRACNVHRSLKHDSRAVWHVDSYSRNHAKRVVKATTDQVPHWKRSKPRWRRQPKNYRGWSCSGCCWCCCGGEAALPSNERDSNDKTDGRKRLLEASETKKRWCLTLYLGIVDTAGHNYYSSFCIRYNAYVVFQSSTKKTPHALCVKYHITPPILGNLECSMGISRPHFF